MNNKSLTTAFILSLFATLVTTIGCATSDRQATTMDQAEPQPAVDASQVQAAPQPDDTIAAPPVVEKTTSEDDLKKKREELDKQQRKLAKQERDLAVAQIKLEKTHLSHKHTDADNEVALAKAEAELALAQRQLEIFQERNAPAKIAWSQLSLTNAEDNAREAQEELEQLELMYNEDEFADQTKEIVIERGKRRLQSSQRDLELRRADFETLKEQTLPVEQREHEMRVTDKHEALKNLRRSLETAALDRKIALINAEGEIIQAEQELQDTRAEIEKLNKAIEQLNEQSSTARESQE